jgi:hypothetical protein
MDFNPDPVPCAIDITLLEEFAAATEVYLDAIKTFQSSIGNGKIHEAYTLAKLARDDCVRSREAVERHRQEHGCRRLGVPLTKLAWRSRR